MKCKVYILLFLLISIAAQPAIGGSVFSSRGFGQPAFLGNSRAMGMGGVGIAVSGPLSLSRLNPAGLSRLLTATINIQYLFVANHYEDGLLAENAIHSNIDGFAFALPLGSGAGFAIGLTPLTRSDYFLSFEESLSGEPYTKSVEGSGGLNTFNFSLFWAIKSYVAVGFSGHYVFGKLVESWEIDYDNSAFYKSTDTYSTKNWGYGFSAGLLLRPITPIEIGAIYSTDYQIGNRTDVYYAFDADNQRSNGELVFPGYWGLGVSYRHKDLFTVAADYQYMLWENMSINQEKLPYTANQSRIALGFEFFNSFEPSSSYFQRMAYRLGFSYQPYFALDAAGKTINEYWATIGFGIPLISHSKLDIAFGYGIRGSVDAHGLKDNMLRISASITGGERWFVRKY